MAMMSLWQIGMLGFLLPEKIDEKSAEGIILLRDNQFWNNCQKSIFSDGWYQSDFLHTS
ncbi:MAG: hypothetical protein ACLR0U_00520 [Enterocloster clostridioformis]